MRQVIFSCIIINNLAIDTKRKLTKITIRYLKQSRCVRKKLLVNEAKNICMKCSRYTRVTYETIVDVKTNIKCNIA